MVMTMVTTGCTMTRGIDEPMVLEPETQESGIRSERTERINQKAVQRFKAMDANRDLFVSREEFISFNIKEAGERFDKMDVNKRGRLSQSEFQEVFVQLKEEKIADKKSRKQERKDRSK